jgi:hypothetical protein
MRHPTLPPEQEIEVDEGAVPHHAGAGWQVVPADELAVRSAEAAKAAAVLTAQRDSEDQSAPAPSAQVSDPSDEKPTPARSRAKSASAPETKGE